MGGGFPSRSVPLRLLDRTGATGDVCRLVVNHPPGADVEVRALTNDPARAALPDNVAADWLLDGDAQVIGHPQPVLSTVPDLLGRPSRTFAEWVRANIEAFR